MEFAKRVETRSREVLGPEHPLSKQAKETRERIQTEMTELLTDPGHKKKTAVLKAMEAANALYCKGKYAEAEQAYRKLFIVSEHELGAEHHATLQSRNNLAFALKAQGKHAEAEKECRAVLAIRERVLGAEHPDTLLSCYDLTLILIKQKKLKDALEFAKRAETGYQKVMEPEHLHTMDAKFLPAYIEAEMKKQ